MNKENVMKHHLCRTALIILSVIVFYPSNLSFAQDGKKFGTKGCVELGGNVSFVSTTPVSVGKTGDAITVLTVAPFLGYFVSDGFELGVNPLSFMSMSQSGNSITQIMVLVAPSYNFPTQGKAYPFIEALLNAALSLLLHTAHCHGSRCRNIPQLSERLRLVRGFMHGDSSGICSTERQTEKSFKNRKLARAECDDMPNEARNDYFLTRISPSFSVVWMSPFNQTQYASLTGIL